jgi:hypothetical protein
MYVFDNYQLGSEDELIYIESSQEHHFAATLMTQQSHREINIISRELDPLVYDVPEFIDSVKKMVLSNRRSKISVIVIEPRAVARRGHLLLELAASLPTFIEFRTPGKEYKHFNESLFVADRTGYVYRNSAERFEGSLSFNDKRKAKVFMNVFDEMWNRSTADPNLRRISL